jgi:hypothetical protein
MLLHDNIMGVNYYPCSTVVMTDYGRTMKGEVKPSAQMAGVEYNRGMVKKPKKQTVYCPPEPVPHVFCGTVLNLAIHKNPEARKLYEQLKVDLNLHGCQKGFCGLRAKPPSVVWSCVTCYY